jgi:hypothetical protein
MRRALLPCLVAALAAAPGLAGTGPRYVGGNTSVVVNRGNGRIAVLRGDKLEVFEAAGTPVSTIELPGKGPRILEFCGGNLLYVTHQVSNLPQVFVVITVDGRERLAFPNEGLSELFPSETSHLTLDGKGVYGFLPLDPPAREFFGLPESIPLGAGVAATYRFAGEKLLARGSEVFVGVAALSPDDMVLTVKGGGAMRHRSPGGVAWKREGSGDDWRLADVDPPAGVAVAIDGQGALLGLDLEKGEVRWQSPAETGLRVCDARLLRGGRVLAFAREPEKQVMVFDPSSGTWSATEVAQAFARQGMRAVLAGWLDRAESLAGLWQIGTASGTALLILGADGWYEIPFP